MLQVVAMPLGHISSFWLSQNTTFAMSRKRRFNVYPGNNKAFYTFWPIQNATCNVASGRRVLRTHFRLLAIPKYDFGYVEKGMIQ